MTVEELKYTAEDLRKFAADRLKAAKDLSGLTLDTFKSAVGIIKDVVKKIDEVKKQFKDITNDQMQDLAVRAVSEVIDFMLAKYLARAGFLGKAAGMLLTKGIRRQLAAMLVDMAVNLIHRGENEKA
jgi:hypothetical protein